MKRLLVPFVLAIMLVITSASWAFYMDFEEGLGNNGAGIVGIPGVTFVNSDGLPWVYGDATTGLYNVTSVNTGSSWNGGNWNMYDSVFAWLGTTGDWGQINFDDGNPSIDLERYINFWSAPL